MLVKGAPTFFCPQEQSREQEPFVFVINGGFKTSPIIHNQQKLESLDLWIWHPGMFPLTQMPFDLFRDQPGIQSMQSKVLLMVLQFGGWRWQTEELIPGIDFDTVDLGETGQEAKHDPFI